MTLVLYAGAALAEIAGCFAFWAWWRLGRTALWIVPGLASLALFAFLLAQIDTSHAGRAYAAYGGVYILSSILWLWAAESATPDGYDLAGTAICLLGAAVILYGPRAA